MADTRKPQEDSEAQARREFLKTIGKLGATVPAVSLLLAASFTPTAANAQSASDACGTPMCGGASGCGGGSIQ